MYNKRKFNKVNDKKVLHKVKKQWVTISLSLLMMIGGGALATHVSANADTNDNVNSSNLDLQLGSSNKTKSTVVNRANSLHNHLANNVAKQDVGHKNSRPLVNNHIARKITNINKLKTNQNGEYNNRVYSRINTPFRTLRINRPVYLHSSVDFDNSHRTGVLPKGQFVRVNRAFKEYGYYNNYLRYELRLADKRNAFITGNKDLVSYVIPRNNYRYYQKQIGNLLKRADYKNATKLTKQFNKLNRQRKHDTNKYVDLYELAYNTQQDFRHPVIVNYHNKVAKINNHHRRIHNHNEQILNSSEVTNNNVAPASNVNSTSESSSLASTSFNVPSYVPVMTPNSVSAVPTPSYSSNTSISSVTSSSASINNNQPISSASSSVSSKSSATSMSSSARSNSTNSTNNSNSNQSSAINSSQASSASVASSANSSAQISSVSASIKSRASSVASSKAKAMSYSASQSNSTKASLSASTSASQSSAKSASVSASESTSASKASSAASVSMSTSVSVSTSASLSNSASMSASASTSASLSTSTSISNSASVSASTSVSTSASMSASASSSKRAASISSASAINTNLSEVAATTLDDINHEREQSGLSALKVNSKLQTVASMRAEQLTKSFSHYNNKGQVYNDLDAQQVAPELVDTIEENISEALIGPNHEEGKNNKGQSDPKLYHNQNGVDMANMMNDGMMNWDADQGNGHRDNILDDTNRIIGIGVAYSPKTNRYYLAEDFSYVPNVPLNKNDSDVTQFQQVK